MRRPIGERLRAPIGDLTFKVGRLVGFGRTHFHVHAVLLDIDLAISDIDLIEIDSKAMTLWKGGRLPCDKVLVGVLGQENPARPGLYGFKGYGSGPNECYEVTDAIVLTADASLSGSGSHFKPTEGSPCVALVGPGGSVWIVGFHLPPKFDQAGGQAPTIGDAGDSAGPLNNVAGDKVLRSDGDAALILKRGGSSVVQGGPGATTSWLKETNTISSRAQNVREQADGFQRSRGRIQIGKLAPETIAIDDHFDQVGPSSTRVRVRHGRVDANVRREITVSKVTYSGGALSGTIALRETYNDDGSWVGEGQKYQFGGKQADEKALLGNVVTSLLKELIDILKNLKVNTAWGPSAPPVADALAKLTELQANYLDSGKITSDYIFLSKTPASPGSVSE